MCRHREVTANGYALWILYWSVVPQQAEYGFGIKFAYTCTCRYTYLKNPGLFSPYSFTNFCEISSEQHALRAHASLAFLFSRSLPAAHHCLVCRREDAKRNARRPAVADFDPCIYTRARVGGGLSAIKVRNRLSAAIRVAQTHWFTGGGGGGGGGPRVLLYRYRCRSVPPGMLLPSLLVVSSACAVTSSPRAGTSTTPRAAMLSLYTKRDPPSGPATDVFRFAKKSVHVKRVLWYTYCSV